jgi:hypothetical protein
MKKIKTLGIWGLLLVGVLFGLGLLGLSANGGQGAAGAIAFTWTPVMGLIYGRKMFNWKKIDTYKTVEEKKNKIVEAADIFVKKILAGPVTGAKMRGPDADLMGQTPVALIMSDTIKSPDRGYEMLFDEVDMRASSNDSFDIMDVSGGVTFYQQRSGEEVKMSKIGKAVKTSVSYLRFSGGLNILDDWIRFNKFYLIDDLFGGTIKRWFNKKATIFYGLLTALGAAIDEAFDTDDVTTINNACAQILTDLEAAGYDVDENSQFVIVCNPKLRARIFKAIAATFVNPNTNNNQIVYNIQAIVSTTKIVNTSYYVCLPGVKSKRGEWDDFQARPAQRDERILGAAHIWTGAYNGIIAEAKQYRRCALS